MRYVIQISLMILLSSGVAAADQGRTEIGPTDTFPIVIDTPGSYVLTADLHVTTSGTNAIEIESDHVTIDLGGHVIRGPLSLATDGNGIFVLDRRGFVVENGHILDFGRGIFVERFGNPQGLGSRIVGLTVTDCGLDGIRIEGGGILRDVIVTDNGNGDSSSYGVECMGCSMRNVHARLNTNGIFVSSGSASGCSSKDNAGVGFLLHSASLESSSSSFNGDDGVSAFFGSVVIGTSVFGNSGWGVLLASSGQNNAVNCSGGSNTLGGIIGCGDGNGCHQNYLP